MHTAILTFPAQRARDAAAVRTLVRLRGAGLPASVIAAAAHAAVRALLSDSASAGWAIHVGCCALRGQPLPRLRAAVRAHPEAPL